MRGLRTLAALAAALLLAVPAVVADEDAVHVATTWLTHAQHKARTPALGDLLAEWKGKGGSCHPPRYFSMTANTPAGVTLRYGTVDLAGRSLLVALGLEGEQGGVLAVDLNGDRNLNGPGEVLRKPGHLTKLAGAPVLKWKFPKQAFGPVELALEFRQLLRCQNAFFVSPAGNQPMTLADVPPAGVQAV